MMLRLIISTSRAVDMLEVLKAALVSALVGDAASSVIVVVLFYFLVVVVVACCCCMLFIAYFIFVILFCGYFSCY